MSELISKNKSYLFEFTKCSKCLQENAPYQNICENCKSYLRDKTVNIDLWTTILKLIENPFEAFRTIVFAEHKNFIFFLLFFISIKNMIIARFISIPELGLRGATSPLFLIILLCLAVTICLAGIISFIQSKVYQKSDIKLRVIDVIALNSYSQVPLVFSLVFIFPVELVVLGSDIFSNNPYSFQIKPTITYILISLETIMIIWSFILYYLSIRFVGLRKFSSFIFTIIYIFIWTLVLFALSKVIFEL